MIIKKNEVKETANIPSKILINKIKRKWMRPWQRLLRRVILYFGVSARTKQQKKHTTEILIRLKGRPHLRRVFSVRSLMKIKTCFGPVFSKIYLVGWCTWFIFIKSRRFANNFVSWYGQNKNNIGMFQRTKWRSIFCLFKMTFSM